MRLWRKKCDCVPSRMSSTTPVPKARCYSTRLGITSLDSLEPCKNRPVFAPAVCVRAVLETSALAAWITEPKIPLEERVKRSFAIRFKAMYEHRKFLDSQKNTSASISHLQTRIDHAITQAGQFGILITHDRKTGKLSGSGAALPNATELIAEVFRDRTSYRFLSGIAHGHPWAMAVGIEIVDNDGVSACIRAGSTLLRLPSVISVPDRSARMQRRVWSGANI